MEQSTTNKKMKRGIILILIGLVLLIFVGIVQADCTELWINNNTNCNGFNYTITYFDYYNCNTTIDLPINNGSVVNCTIDNSVCDNNICINPILSNSTCCIVTPVINCIVYDYELYTNNGTLIDNGLMLPFINDTYYFLFTQDVGSYYVKVCDDSTRQLIVESGDNMIGFTTDTWINGLLILLFVLFLFLAFKVDSLFLVLDGIIFMYFAFLSFKLYDSWFITVLLGLVGVLFIFGAIIIKLHEK